MNSTLLALTLLLPLPPADAPKVEPLWPNGAPDAKGTEAADKPTLTIFLPSEGKANGSAVVVCPGGGYHDLYWELEGEEVAAWLNSAGMTGIILKYRCPRRPGDVRT